MRGAVASTGGRTTASIVRAAGRAADWAAARWAQLDRLQPLRVIAFFVVAEWAAVAALAVAVRHNGWIYYQGGDQLWYYTSGWLLAHGQIGYPLVGYLWSGLMAPLAWIAGPNVANAYPAIVLVDTLVLLPAALASLYGLARLIGGRRFGFLALLVWLVAPFAGILLTDLGYHQRYTELTLPQAFGLTAMADFPTMVAALVAAYFTARVLFDGRDERLDALAAGVAAGAATAIKPSTALFLAGPVLALVTAKRFRALAVLLVGLLPAVATLALWKWRGLHYLPVVRGISAPVRSAAGTEPVLAVHVPQYLNFDWGHFIQQLDLLREHFWSGRLIEWLVIAGLIAVGHRSRRALALLGAWFVAFMLVKGGYSHAGIEDASLLRLMIPTIPPFVLMLAALPFLLPRGGRPWPEVEAPARAPTRLRTGGVAIGIVVTAVIPFAAIAAATPVTGPHDAVIIQQPQIPSIELGAVAHLSSTGTVVVKWRHESALGGRIFFHVFRSPAGSGAFACDTTTPAQRCTLIGTDLGTTRITTFSDRPPPGNWDYRVGIAANWMDDVTQGDVYVLSFPASVQRR